MQIHGQLRWDKFIAQYGSDKVLRDFFAGNKAMFDGSQVRAKHILVAATANNPQALEQAKARVLQLKKYLEEYRGSRPIMPLIACVRQETRAALSANAEWTRQAMAIVEPDLLPGRYINELSDAGPEVTRASYGDEKLQRLRELKRAWDPTNVFRLNHNIAP